MKHNVGEPLKGWCRPKNKNSWTGKFNTDDYVAVRYKDVDDAFDKIHDGPHSIPVTGKPGIIPTGECLWFDNLRWCAMPKQYLEAVMQVVPSAEVRRLPALVDGKLQ